MNIKWIKSCMQSVWITKFKLKFYSLLIKWCIKLCIKRWIRPMHGGLTVIFLFYFFLSQNKGTGKEKKEERERDLTYHLINILQLFSGQEHMCCNIFTYSQWKTIWKKSSPEVNQCTDLPPTFVQHEYRDTFGS